MSAKPPERPPRSEMMTGLFRDRLSAERAYDTLRARGYTDADINVLMTDETRKNWYPTDDAATNLGRKAGTKAMAGAGVGGVIGTAGRCPGGGDRYHGGDRPPGRGLGDRRAAGGRLGRGWSGRPDGRTGWSPCRLGHPGGPGSAL